MKPTTKCPVRGCKKGKTISDHLCWAHYHAAEPAEKAIMRISETLIAQGEMDILHAEARIEEAKGHRRNVLKRLADRDRPLTSRRRK